MSIAQAGTKANQTGIRNARKEGGDYYQPWIRQKGDKTKEARLRLIKRRERLIDRLLGCAK